MKKITVQLDPSIHLTRKPKGQEEYRPLAGRVAFGCNPVILTPQEFTKMVSEQGVPFFSSSFYRPEKEDYWRLRNYPGKVYYRCTHLFALDFDEQDFNFREAVKMVVRSMEEFDPICIYHSFSSTPQHNRLRVVYHCDEPFTPYDEHKERVKYLNVKYFKGQADKSCITPVKFWQGSTRGGFCFAL